MSGETLYQAPRKHKVSKIRVHDYLYDPVFIVSGARDYARTTFKAAMASAQLIIQPVYNTMFSELRKFPSMNVVYHPNCRLPPHMDRSYAAYVERVQEDRTQLAPDLAGKDRFKFTAFPKKILPLKPACPDFQPPTPKYDALVPGKPRNRGTQSVYRESSAQTKPWQPDGKPGDCCETTPEVLYLDKLEWGPGNPYRTGDLPADFHTTEIINKMRHARVWMGVVESAKFPRWMKKADAIITDVETKDWIFREAEIDELQDIRLSLLHKLQNEKRSKQSNRTSRKLAKLWAAKKDEMQQKVALIRRSRDREIRKLTALHSSGGRQGLVQRMRASRGGGSVTAAAHDPTSDVHAPLARHGYQARKRHAEIIYDPSLLALEDHKKLSEPPAWLTQCGQDLKLSCSGHNLPRDPRQLCERETKWSEQFLANLHDELKRARLGAVVSSSGPLRVLKPRRIAETPRPATPEVDVVPDDDEACHQAALQIQKIIRGRAVQCLMYEGRTRASELTEELKTTHGLQKEDRNRIAKEETKARDFTANRRESDEKEDAVSALVDELCGSAVAAALDFLEKELRRLKDERRQHAFMLIALREKQMREAAEAGRRQKEEHRRREHDEMFKQLLGVTQETVEAYLQEIIVEGVELAAEEDAVARAKGDADRIDKELKEQKNLSTAEQNELVAELVHQFLLPEAHKAAARHRISSLQEGRLEAARAAIFNVIDEAEVKEKICTQCGMPLDELCRCRECGYTPQIPVQTESRDDPRWKASRTRKPVEIKTIGERFPPAVDFRYLLHTLVDEAVYESRASRKSREESCREYGEMIKHRIEATLDAQEIVDHLFDRATGAYVPPVKDADYHHYMVRVVGDALQRTEPYPKKTLCPQELPSQIRQREEEEAAKLDPTCRCVEPSPSENVALEAFEHLSQEEKMKLLPSTLRELEELRRCKCDVSPSVPGSHSELGEETKEDVYKLTSDTSQTTVYSPEVKGEPFIATSVKFEDVHEKD